MRLWAASLDSTCICVLRLYSIELELPKKEMPQRVRTPEPTRPFSHCVKIHVFRVHENDKQFVVRGKPIQILYVPTAAVGSKKRPTALQPRHIFLYLQLELELV